MRPKNSEKTELLEKKIQAYFDECDIANGNGSGKIKKPYTLSGLLYGLDITRNEFERMCAKPGFSKLLSKALSKIEAFIEENTLTGGLSATAAANSLKYNFGWGDKKTCDDAEPERSIKIILDGDIVSLAE